MTQNPAQVSLRPNNRLSDMQAIMEQTQAFENRVLERLNAGKTVRSFLITAVELLTEAVNILVLQVFRKDDYAVKYAVEPLLDGDGPLGDLSVRLKLIYGLGVLSRTEYEDAELLMALREELNHDGNEYAFTDDEILGPFGELHCVMAL
ncbi:mannitol operon repressor MtlR, partial [Salmonella enterica]